MHDSVAVGELGDGRSLGIHPLRELSNIIGELRRCPNTDPMKTSGWSAKAQVGISRTALAIKVDAPEASDEVQRRALLLATQITQKRPVTLERSRVILSFCANQNRLGRVAKSNRRVEPRTAGRILRRQRRIAAELSPEKKAKRKRQDGARERVSESCTDAKARAEMP